MRGLGLLLLLAALPVNAQREPLTLDRVVVTATRTERAQFDVPASTDVIERNEVRDGNLRVNLSESLARVPGVVALNRQNYAQDLQISVRGFGARSTFGVRGVRLYVDGIPATMPDGQGQPSHFALGAVERIARKLDGARIGRGQDFLQPFDFLPNFLQFIGIQQIRFIAC